MEVFQLNKDWIFNEKDPYAEPLHVDPEKRVLRFALRPGQEVREHLAPHSPVLIVILQGEGVFTGGDDVEQRFGEQTLLIIDSGEKHSIRALDNDLVFVAFLHGVPGGR